MYLGFFEEEYQFKTLKSSNSKLLGIKPSKSSVTFLYPLKTSENQRFSHVFMGYRNVTLD